MSRTQCGCGMIHDFPGAGDPPEFLDCGECPICEGQMNESDDFSKYNFNAGPYDQKTDDDLGPTEKLKDIELDGDLRIDDDDLDDLGEYREEY